MKRKEYISIVKARQRQPHSGVKEPPRGRGHALPEEGQHRPQVISEPRGGLSISLRYLNAASAQGMFHLLHMCTKSVQSK